MRITFLRGHPVTHAPVLTTRTLSKHEIQITIMSSKVKNFELEVISVSLMINRHCLGAEAADHEIVLNVSRQRCCVTSFHFPPPFTSLSRRRFGEHDSQCNQLWQ